MAVHKNCFEVTIARNDLGSLGKNVIWLHSVNVPILPGTLSQTHTRIHNHEDADKDMLLLFV